MGIEVRSTCQPSVSTNQGIRREVKADCSAETHYPNGEQYNVSADGQATIVRTDGKKEQVPFGDMVPLSSPSQLDIKR